MGNRNSLAARERSKGEKKCISSCSHEKETIRKHSGLEGIEWRIRSDERPGIVLVMYSGCTSGFRVMREEKVCTP